MTLDVDLPEVGVGAILLGAAERWPDRTAFRFDGGELLGFADLLAEASRFAHGLAAYGVGKNDVVASLLPNVHSFPIVYYGTMLSGATFVPFNPLLPPAELAVLLADSGATVLVTHSPAAVPSADVIDRTKVRTVIADLATVVHGRPRTPPMVDVDAGSDLAHLTYTGGTTGRSKGVLITHRSAVAFAVQYACWVTGGVPRLDARGGLTIEQRDPAGEFPVRVGEDLTVSVTPWFHTMGLNACLNLPVLIGMTQVVHARLSVPKFLADMEEFSATLFGGAPALFAVLAAHSSFETRDLSSVRSVYSAAAPLPPRLFERLQARWPDATVCEIYGLTEASAVASAPWHRSGVRKPGSVGLPLPHTEIKIVPADAERVDDSTPEVPAGVEGEVCVRGPQVMAGYLHRPEETADVLSADGWLRTGDIGTIDDRGYLSIVDRRKDVILCLGYSIYPRELEDILLTHPGVLAAAVVGRPHPVAGETPIAFVVTANGTTEQELRGYLNSRVAPQKKVRDIVFVDQIPMSDTGKTLRRQLRERSALDPG